MVATTGSRTRPRPLTFLLFLKMAEERATITG